EIEDDYDKNDYGGYYNSEGEFETLLGYGECKKINYHYGNCLCGTQEMSFKDAEHYSCELGLAWRCQKESCACGGIQCKKNQICLKPGVCSQ
ncbi:MAG: hypothetical protein J6A01_07920, partial [Proteobacteria bacterium]|nr:hypothetical protein [Pseudomonadota bacterium]